MTSYIDKDIDLHSFEEKDSKNKQEGTLMSPPIIVHRISINGIEDNYVTYSDHNRIVADKDAEIARLKKELSEIKNNIVTKEIIKELLGNFNKQQPSPNESTANSDKSSYHDVHFDNKVDVPALTQELILFSEKKKGIDERVWLINSLKSWGIVFKIFKDKNIFIGNNTDFCKYLQEEVFPNVKDVNRKMYLLKLKPSNITHLSSEIKDKKTFEWKQEYTNNPKQKKYEECIVILTIIEKIIPKIKKNK